MIEDRPATQAEAYREMVVNMGQDRPQECWILTPYDTWERNPAYVGPDEPHPEDNRPDCVPATPSYGDEDFNRQFEEWQGDSREGGTGCD